MSTSPALDRSLATRPSITCSPEVFERNLNLLPFEVEHTLAGDPLFAVPALVELAVQINNRQDPHRQYGDVSCLLGRPKLGEGALEGSVFAPSVQQAIEGIEHSDAWLMLNHIEYEEAYRGVLERTICDVLRLTRRNLLNKVKWFEAIIFVTSPNRLTPYHLDRECAWLLQIQGKKEIHLFNRNDKDLVPDAELERYWAADNQSAQYKPELEERAMVFQLRPGNGVHIPVNTPHWLKNGNNVSVSMNVNFVFHDSEWGNIHKANYYLRKRGIQPAPAGTHPLADRAKSAVISVGQRMKHLVRGSDYVPKRAQEQKKRVRELLQHHSG
jgi:D-lyxose ketol-isomerase